MSERASPLRSARPTGTHSSTTAGTFLAFLSFGADASAHTKRRGLECGTRESCDRRDLQDGRMVRLCVRQDVAFAARSSRSPHPQTLPGGVPPAAVAGVVACECRLPARHCAANGSATECARLSPAHESVLPNVSMRRRFVSAASFSPLSYSAFAAPCSRARRSRSATTACSEAMSGAKFPLAVLDQ